MAHILSSGSPSVHTESEPVAYEEYLWRAAQNEDWHDLDGPEFWPSDQDCSLDFEDEHAAEVIAWFRRNRCERVGDLDQPHYRYLGLASGYIAEV